MRKDDFLTLEVKFCDRAVQNKHFYYLSARTEIFSKIQIDIKFRFQTSLFTTLFKKNDQILFALRHKKYAFGLSDYNKLISKINFCKNEMGALFSI